MVRAAAEAPMPPKFASVVVTAGPFRINVCWLKMLNASARNCSERVSPRLKFLKRLKSHFRYACARSGFLGASPTVPGRGAV